MIAQLQRLLEPLQRRIIGMVARAVIQQADDSGGVQVLYLQCANGDNPLPTIKLGQYGFTSVPLPGAEAAAIFKGGNQEAGLAIAIEDRRYRLKGLSGGEVALYTDEGDFIKLGRNNTIQVSTKILQIVAATSCDINSPAVTVECTNLTATVGGDLDADVTGDANVDAANINATASAMATVTAPTLTLVAATSIVATTPLLAVSGVLSCSGIATGGGTPSPGNAVISGNVTATGNVHSTGGQVSDSVGSMAAMRTTFDAHTHGGVTTGGGSTTGPTPTM